MVNFIQFLILWDFAKFPKEIDKIQILKNIRKEKQKIGFKEPFRPSGPFKLNYKNTFQSFPKHMPCPYKKVSNLKKKLDPKKENFRQTHNYKSTPCPSIALINAKCSLR